MEHRMFVRRGEGMRAKRTILRVVRAGNDGMGTGGGIAPSRVSEKSFTLGSVHSRGLTGHTPQKYSSTTVSEETVRNCAAPEMCNLM